MIAFLRKIAVADKGMEVVEYAVVAGLMVVGIITVLAAIGIWVVKQYQDFKTVSGA